jgi:hypothetical protein
MDLCKKYIKDKEILPDDIKKYVNSKIFIIVNCIVDKPTFDS